MITARQRLADYHRKPSVDRVTRLRLWAESSYADGMELAIAFNRRKGISLSDDELRTLAEVGQRYITRAFENGVCLGRDLGPVCEHCGQDIEPVGGA